MIKQGAMYRSTDGEYVYNIFSYQDGEPEMVMDILDSNLSFIMTKHNYSVAKFMGQLDAGTIINYIDTDVEPNETE